MKYLQKIIGILFSIFLLLPLSTHASSFSFTSNSSLLTTTCTESKCTFVITWKGTTKAQLPFSLWKTKDSSGALKDKVFETQTIFDPAQKKTSSTFSIENLLPDTYYYINYDGFFTIKTEPITVVKSGANQLKLTPNNTSLVASIVTSPTETRPLSINFESPLSPGISVLRKSVPLDVATKSRKGIALFDMGEIPLPIGSYGAYLEAGQVPVYTKLVGPFPYEVHDTSLTYQWPLTVKDKSDTSITLSGKITAAKNVDPTTYTITFEVADTATVFDPNSKGSGDTEVRQAQVSKIGTDGSYSVTINNLTASQVYYFRHTIQSPFSPSQSKVGKFSGTDGLLAYGDDGDPQKDFNNRSYRLLSPLPGLSAVLDPDLCAEYAKEGKDLSKGTICDINQFINYIMKLLIGLAGVMLVLRIMFEGYQYLVTDVPALKSGAKNSIVESALGLVLALSAYLILNTINPQLVSNGVQLNDVAAGVEIVNLPDAGDGTIDSNFNGGKGTYSTDDTVSPEVIKVTEKLKAGWQIDYFKVYTNDRMLIAIKNGAQTDTSNVISISHGLNGFAAPGTSKIGDRKTPVGIWKILDIRKPKGENQAVFNGNGSNMGAAFFHLSPMISGERGIGMHGNKRGTLSATYGCIRMKNADILALLPYIKTGTSVYIGK